MADADLAVVVEAVVVAALEADAAVVVDAAAVVVVETVVAAAAAVDGIEARAGKFQQRSQADLRVCLLVWLDEHVLFGVARSNLIRLERYCEFEPITSSPLLNSPVEPSIALDSVEVV